MHDRAVSYVRAMVAALAVLVVIRAETARADCPTTVDDAVCRPWTAVFLPTAFGVTYAPHDAQGTWYGGGFEATLLAWSDNTPAFGPSQGRLRFDVAVLTSSEMGAGTMAMYRGGAQVSIERNASRRFLIPYFNADLGGLWTRATGSRPFADAGLGLYVLYVRTAIVSIEADGVLPFSNPSRLGGVRGELSVSFALW